MGRRSTALVATSAVVTAILGAGSVDAHAEDRDYVLSEGHIDLFEVTYDDATDSLTLLVKDDTGLYDDTVAFRDPADVTVAADADTARVVVPDLPDECECDFLGEPGDVVYLLPLSQAEGLPWPGWSTERLLGTLPTGVDLAADAPVTLSVEVVGPGDVHSYMWSPFGSAINHYVDTTDAGPDAIPVDASAHVHTEWAFTQQGDYTFLVTPTARTTTGAVLDGPTRDYHIRIGAGAPATTTTAVAISGGPQVYGDRTPATVTAEVAAGADEGVGTVDVVVDGAVVRDDVPLVTGAAQVVLPRRLSPGRHSVVATFTPADPAVQGASTSSAGEARVVKAPAAVHARLVDRRVPRSDRAKMHASVTLPMSTGVVARGRVVVYEGKRRIAGARLRRGEATVRLPGLAQGRHSLTVAYVGSALVRADASRVRRLTVTR